MTPKKLFKVCLLTFVLLFSMKIKAQEMKEVKDQTYVITDNGSVSNIQPYIDALNNSDMRYHRLKNVRNTIVFDTGVTVQLFSATEMIAEGKALNPADYPESFDASRDVPAFSLGPNNIIMEMHHVTSKHR
jgi:hypothetical protein